MEPITRESFGKWAQKNNWLLVNEAATPNGRQHNYVTPSGSIAIAMYDLKGNLNSLGQPMAQPPPQGIPTLRKGNHG